MELILEVRAGRLAGKRVAVPEGRKVTVGRAADRAQFAVSGDSYMSSVHFSVECASGGCKIKDRKSSNGTFLNGSRITEAPLADGDEIRSGRTIFVAHIVAGEQVSPESKPAIKPPAAKPAPPTAEARPAARREPKASPTAPAPQSEPSIRVAPSEPAAVSPPRSEPAAPKAPAPARPVAATPLAGKAAMTIGSWRFAVLPENWVAQGEFGIQRMEKDAFPSNVVVSEEMLGLSTLQQFVEGQVAMLRQYLHDPRIEPSLPPAIAGAEETVTLDIRYRTKDEQVILLLRILARRGKRVGILTLTTLEKDLEEIRPALDAILAGATFEPPE